jgi:hypothetical protein
VAEAVAAQTRNAAVVDAAPLAHDAALLVTGRRCTSGRSTPGPIRAAVHPAVSQRRQRPLRPGVATSSAPICQPQQTHNGAVMVHRVSRPHNEGTGAAACYSGSPQACSAALLLPLAALLTALVSLLSTFLRSDGPEQFGLHDAHGHPHRCSDEVHSMVCHRHSRNAHFLSP